jgi:Zn-dependent protease with chaperone function
MIFNAPSVGLSVGLNAIAIGIASLWVAIAIISTFTLIGLGHLNSFNAAIRVRLLWSIVVLPWIVAAVSIVLLLSPEIFEYRIGWLSSIFYLHHGDVFAFFSWHGGPLMIFFAMFLIVSIGKISSAIKTSLKLSQLNYFSVSEELEGGTLLVDSDTQLAFTAGLFYPRSYITHGLRKKLSNESLRIVQQHELAHVHGRDPLRKHVFSLLALFFPKSVGGRLSDAFSLALEQLADQSALKLVQDKKLVSRTILEVARLNSHVSCSTQLSTIECGFTSDALDLRIRYLLDGEPNTPFPYLKLVVSILVMIAVCTLTVDLIHHSVETLFTH